MFEKIKTCCLFEYTKGRKVALTDLLKRLCLIPMLEVFDGLFSMFLKSHCSTDFLLVTVTI